MGRRRSRDGLNLGPLRTEPGGAASGAGAKEERLTGQLGITARRKNCVCFALPSMFFWRSLKGDGCRSVAVLVEGLFAGGPIRARQVPRVVPVDDHLRAHPL